MSRSHSGISFIAPFLVLFIFAAPVNAVSIPVDPVVGIDPDGDCSLLEALENAEQDALIHRDCPSGARGDRLVLTANHEYVLEGPWPGTSSGTPILTDDLEIIGNGAMIHRDIASAEFRLFEIRGGRIELDGLTLSGGLSFGSMAGGGAVLVDSADLTIRNSTLVDNTAVGLFVFGGAIRMDAATVLIEDSVIEGNTAFTDNPEMGGGGIAQFDGELTIRRSALLDNWADFNCNESSPDSAASTGGALRVEAVGSGGAQIFIEDSTLAGNIGRVGGAIHIVAIADTGVSGIQDVFVQLLRSTVVHNRAPSCGGLIGLGAGLYVQEANGGQGLITYGNSIVLGNGRAFNGQLIGDDCSSNSPNSDFFSLEGNVLDPDDACPTLGFDALEASVFSVLSSRQDNAYRPLANGPAVDLPEAAINCVLSAPDQLGNPRAAGPGQGGDLCDAGAVELQPIGFEYTLQVTIDGSGGGFVSSAPAGIFCGATCSADFTNGTPVELSPLPAAGDSFGGWSGACSGIGSCTVTMDQAQTVTATFDAPSSFTLNVGVLGGDGTVTSNPAGIDCPGTCSFNFPSSTVVELTQSPDPGFFFNGWGGACGGEGACLVTLDQERSVAANYTAVETHPLTVSVVGAGRVVSTPARIDCTPFCTADFALGELVVLNANPAPGEQFLSWSGDCAGTGICSVTMDAARQVTARFTEPQVFVPLSINLEGGNGRVVSDPAGIDCPGSCTNEFPLGDEVQLSQTPASGFGFDGWTGDCGGDGSCVVTMDVARSVTANFVEQNQLTVSVDGSGSVSSSPAGINCPGNCSAGFLPADKVLLTPEAAPGAVFIGWGGDCTGTSVCVVSMDQARAVTATFEQNGFDLAIVLTGAGSGRVFGDQGQIDCPGMCSATIAPGTVVTLSISVEPGSVFQGYSGDCDGGNCSVTMDTDRTVYATFLSADQLFLNSFE